MIAALSATIGHPTFKGNILTSALKKSSAQDRARISLNDESEIHFWTKKFKVGRDELDEAIQTVGRSAQAVADFLKKKL